jgi:hypothetical protein
MQGAGKILTRTHGELGESNQGRNLITPRSFPCPAQESMHSKEGKALLRPTLTAEEKRVDVDGKDREEERRRESMRGQGGQTPSHLSTMR